MLYHLYYFSATGNTERAVRIISEELQRHGHQVKSVRLNRNARPFTELPDRLLIAFPTFSWVPPVLVQRFIRFLPKGKSTDGSRVRAAVFTADGGGCLQAPDQARRMLQRRGYRVFLTGRAAFPDNWQQFVPGPEEKKKAELIAGGEQMTRDFARRLLEEKESRLKTAWFNLAWSRLVGILFAFFGRRFMGKMFIADSDCNSCGLCQTSCPVGAIIMSGRKKARPFWKANCESCNRCINICPRQAIVCSYARTVVLTATITAGLSLVLGLHAAWLKPGLAEALPHSVYSILNFLQVLLLVIGVSFLVIGPFDRYLLCLLQRTPYIDKIFSLGFNKKFRRYLMPGFRPPLENSERNKS